MTRSASPNGAPPIVRPTWKDSDRFVPRAFVRPALRFTRVEAAGGVVMLVAALVALAWANSPWHAGYERFLSTPFELSFGALVHLDGHAEPPLAAKRLVGGHSYTSRSSSILRAHTGHQGGSFWFMRHSRTGRNRPCR